MDKTEGTRRLMVQDINSGPKTREALEEEHGKDNVWNTGELTTTFAVDGFMAPYAVVEHKETGKKGTVMFQDTPRIYFNFRPHEV